MAQISLIITVYNKVNFVTRCLESVAKQTDKSAQIIIVDDGSTDGSDKICDQYAKEYGWEIYHTKNNGVAEARNFGMDKATGDYIAFLDADDAILSITLEIMNKIARHDFNIYQFGQIRWASGNVRNTYRVVSNKGEYILETDMPKHWQMVWNKMYKTSFLKKYRIRFKKGMQFGEDECFNVKCILANGGLYQAPQILMEHYFDDLNSICRGHLNKELLNGLIKELKNIASKQKSIKKKQWVENLIERHEHSDLFLRLGYERKNTGKYDIVYFVKQNPINEELRYSLRSVEKNCRYNTVWFYGGCPDGLKPDHYVWCSQNELSKWERVRGMLRQACLNDEITEDFWLFNDDFFVMKPMSENMPPQCNKTLQDRIKGIESRHGGETEYTAQLKHLVKTLEKAGKGMVDYTVHKPMLINRKKMLEVLDKFPKEPMFRALYGNYWEIGGESKHDMKISKVDYNQTVYAINNWEFISTGDNSFARGKVGRYLRDIFSIKSRFEV